MENDNTDITNTLEVSPEHSNIGSKCHNIRRRETSDPMCFSMYLCRRCRGYLQQGVPYDSTNFAIRDWVTSASAFVGDMSIRFKNMSLEACRRNVCCVREVHKVELMSGCASESS